MKTDKNQIKKDFERERNFFSIFIALGFFVMIGGLIFLEPLFWEQTTGEITGTRIREYEENPPTEYWLYVEYSFTVSGKEYYGDHRESSGGTWYQSENISEVEAEALKFKIGDTINVYYSSLDPSRNAVERSLDGPIIIFIIGGGMIGSGILLFRRAKRKFNQQNVIAGINFYESMQDETVSPDSLLKLTDWEYMFVNIYTLGAGIVGMFVMIKYDVNGEPPSPIVITVLMIILVLTFYTAYLGKNRSDLFFERFHQEDLSYIHYILTLITSYLSFFIALILAFTLDGTKFDGSERLPLDLTIALIAVAIISISYLIWIFRRLTHEPFSSVRSDVYIMCVSAVGILFGLRMYAERDYELIEQVNSSYLLVSGIIISISGIYLIQSAKNLGIVTEKGISELFMKIIPIIILTFFWRNRSTDPVILVILTFLMVIFSLTLIKFQDFVNWLKLKSISQSS